MKESKFLFLIFLLGFQQCIAFSKYTLPDTKSQNQSESGKKTILITYTQAATVGNRERKVADEGSRKESEERIVRVLKLHPRVLAVTTDPNAKYDLKLDINVESQVSFYSSTLGMIMTGISFLTLTALPSDVEQNSTFTFQFSNEKNQTKFTVVRMVYFNTWIGILTIPLMPFYGLNGTAEKAFLDVSHSAVNEAIEKQAKLF